jgi:DNA-binding transcriptional MerR regulator
VFDANATPRCFPILSIPSLPTGATSRILANMMLTLEERIPTVEVTYNLADLISQLATLEGVSLNERVVRQYLADGLLPAPGQRGGAKPYGEDHLVHLRLVARLSSQYVPPREIQRFVGRLSPEGMKSLVDRPLPSRLPSEGDAQAYLNRLSRSLPSMLISQALFTGAIQTPPRTAAATPRPRGVSPAPAADTPTKELVQAATPKTAPRAMRSPWIRVTVDPDVEISVRANGHDQKRLVDALIAAVQDVLANERGASL